MNLARVPPEPKSGSEVLHDGNAPLGATLTDFWRWSASDLLSNATRGRLAEFIVAKALEIPTSDVRDEWAPWDLTTPEGTRVEVKSASYLQSWFQAKPSTICFSTRPTAAWDADTNTFTTIKTRQAKVYVFALLAHKEDKLRIDPLDVSQWQFFVVPTPVLDAYTRSQHSITHRSLLGLAQPVASRELRAHVRAASATAAAVSLGGVPPA
jgi:hypothetical protein